MFFTSANGYVFSQLNKAREIGKWLSKESGVRFREEYNATGFKSYNINMQAALLYLKHCVKI